MKCPMCDNELQGKQKYCSAACRKKASRQSENISTRVKKNGHWFGRAPHTPLWLPCDKADCPYNHNKEIDWVPSCTKPCCA